jgi:L,D-transpeptidase YcbB
LLSPLDKSDSPNAQPVAAPAETGSIEPATVAPHADAAIGQAARNMLTPPKSSDHLLPEAATAAATPEANSPPLKPSPEERDRIALLDVYQSRGDEPLWVTASGYTDKAKAVITELKRAADWGFDPADYDVTDPGSSPAPEQVALAESALSLAVMTYARHARGGLIAEPAKQLSSYYDRRPSLRDRKLLLEELAKSNDPARVLSGLHPQHAQFIALRQAWLEAVRTAKGKAPKLPTGGDLKPGDQHADIAILRKRMAVPAENGTDETRFDERLVAAVSAYQSYLGLEPADGTLTTATRAKLNQPVKGRADQLLANMQAWRYLPEDLGNMYVWVNVPEYTIRIVKDGEVIFTERITAGLVNKQTPIFSDEMERVTFKSRWRIPDSIKVRELWPSLLGGGGLVRQHRVEFRKAETDELVDWRKINWSKADMNDYVAWQPPGPWNQLGIVKFSFPSKHRVFMHDTPDKYMFSWTRRANSHGCMRIRNPLNMASVILGNDKGWDRGKIDDLVKNGPAHNIIELEKKIPVHITYFTARAEKDGKISTWGDIYGHERRVSQALAGKWDKIAKGPDHLAPLDQSAVPRVAVARKAPPKPGNDSVQSLVNAVLGGF